MSEQSDLKGFYAIYPDGEGDVPPGYNTQNYRSWNGVGTSQSPSVQFGTTCNVDDRIEGPCYQSCNNRSGPEFTGNGSRANCAQGCDWTTCHDDITFVSVLLDAMEEALCLDRSRFYATGNDTTRHDTTGTFTKDKNRP